MLTHSLIQYLTLPATPPSPVALAAGVRFIHKARLYEREIKDSLSPITRIVTVQELEIERRRMENQKLRKEIETVEDNEHPQPVAININVVDARVRSDEDDLSDA